MTRGVFKILGGPQQSPNRVEESARREEAAFPSFQDEYCAPVVEIAERDVRSIAWSRRDRLRSMLEPRVGIGCSKFGAQCAVGVDKKMAYASSASACRTCLSGVGATPNGLAESRTSVFGVHGAQIVRELTGRDVKVVLDPTMLQTAKWWSEIEERPIIPGIDLEGPFCLKYVLGDDTASAKIAERCGRDGLGLVDLTDIHLPVGPAEFVWLIHHSALVCTDSFHATVFSLLFHRPFVIYERRGNAGNMSSRFDTLHALFGISSTAPVRIASASAASMSSIGPASSGGLRRRGNDSVTWLRAALASLWGGYVQ